VAIDESKEDKATGPDDTPVTLWKRSTTGKAALCAILQLMLLYECTPDKALDMYVVFANKPGCMYSNMYCLMCYLVCYLILPRYL
jgi:hypothetical protein